ncbi:MAG: FIST C-terminal domain-containing protein, partial [Mameliella sp.]|nr:FIST C-terminal domain-containing protein [Phaeodactylibacter sp.]
IVVGLALYNPDLKVGYGSLGGWDTFGIERRVTKSEANVLYEIDDQPALELYKSFLGDQAKGLPASGLLFPLSMRINKDDPPIVRTILAVDEESQSLTFAGNIPKGAYVKLMKANIDRLINGAEGAAKVSFEAGNKPELAVLISCVGRKLVLKQLVEEEVEAV